MIGDTITTHLFDRFWTNIAATGAAITPLWYDHLRNISEVAAILLPILGCSWLAIQMIAFFVRRNNK